MAALIAARLDDRPGELARRSRAWDRLRGADASLVVGVPASEAIVLGAFQRPSEAPAGEPLVRRGSGGASARVGPGSVWVTLALSRPEALVPCTADKLLNRYVRPLLRALTRASSIPASYFGRDWISAGHRPVALVAFAHDAATGASLFEALVAVRTSFVPSSRPSLLGKEPATLEELARRAIDPAAVADAVVDSYRRITPDLRVIDALPPSAGSVEEDLVLPEERRWAATRDEAIGTIAAGRDASGRLRIGGELMASRDAIARLEDEVANLPQSPSLDAIGAVVDDALTARGAITFGVRSLTSIRDVIFDALRAET